MFDIFIIVVTPWIIGSGVFRSISIDTKMLSFIQTLPSLYLYTAWGSSLSNIRSSIAGFYICCSPNLPERQLSSFVLLPVINWQPFSWPYNAAYPISLTFVLVTGVRYKVCDAHFLMVRDSRSMTQTSQPASLAPLVMSMGSLPVTGREAFFRHVYELLEEKTTLAAWDNGRYSW